MRKFAKKRQDMLKLFGLNTMRVKSPLKKFWIFFSLFIIPIIGGQGNDIGPQYRSEVFTDDQSFVSEYISKLDRP